MLELLRQFLRRKPFRPFRVVLRSGARYDIREPDKVAIGPSKAYAFLPPRYGITVLPEDDIELVYERRDLRRM